MNDALVAPAGIVTLWGGEAALELLESFTTRPPVGAAPEIVTVPVDDVNPITDVGATVIDRRVGGVMFRSAD